MRVLQSGFSLIESENCKFCNIAPETFFHHFSHVLLLLQFGKMFTLLFLSFLKIFFLLIILVKSFENQKFTIVNAIFIRLIVYFYVQDLLLYKCKYDNRIPKTSNFDQQVQKIKVIEIYYIKKNNVCFSACLVRASGRFSWFEFYVRFFNQTAAFLSLLIVDLL